MKQNDGTILDSVTSSSWQVSSTDALPAGSAVTLQLFIDSFLRASLQAKPSWFYSNYSRTSGIVSKPCTIWKKLKKSCSVFTKQKNLQKVKEMAEKKSISIFAGSTVVLSITWISTRKHSRSDWDEDKTFSCSFSSVILWTFNWTAVSETIRTLGILHRGWDWVNFCATTMCRKHSKHPQCSVSTGSWWN